MAEIVKTQKKSSFFKKLFLIFFVILISYTSFRYYKFKTQKAAQLQNENHKFSNIESEIFDFSDNKNPAENFDDAKIFDLTVTELRERGAEFIYQLLLRNQVQISELRKQNQELKTEFARYKNEQRNTRIIFVYVDLRQKIYAGDNFAESLKSVEILASLDKNLKEKIDALKTKLQKFHGTKNLSQQFSSLIPSLIAAKHNDPHANLIKKMRHYFAKLIIVRKLDATSQDVDGMTRATEISLQNQDFENALKSFILLDESYQKISPEFFDNLKAAAEMQKIDHDILLYLQGII